MKAVSITTQVEKRSIVPPERPSLWMIREDREIFGRIRTCAPCPAVIVLKDDPHAVIGEQQQYYLRGINYNMSLEDVYLLLDKGLAFANGTGFRNEGDPRADYLHRRDLTYKPPNLDKVRTCSRNVITGFEAYSLLQAFKNIIAVARTLLTNRSLTRNARLAFTRALTAQNVLNVQTFDSRTTPILKPGRSYPSRVEDVNPDDYLFTPRTHPWMFVVANIVNRAGEVVQFPRGGLYAWTGDRTPYSFLPLISNHGYGDVLYPLDFLMPIASYQEIPSPYRFA